MAALVKYRANLESGLDEVESFTIIPKHKRPAILPDSTLYVDNLPEGFPSEWYKYYIAEGVLQYNGSRVSIEACVGV